MRVEYDTDIPAVVRGEIEPVLADLAWLIPGWCQRVLVSWAAETEDAPIMRTWCSYEYRYTCLEVHPAYLHQTAADRPWQMMHELLHAFTDLVVNHSREAFERLLPEPGQQVLLKTLIDELRVRNESLVQDLAWSLRASLESHGG